MLDPFTPIFNLSPDLAQSLTQKSHFSHIYCLTTALGLLHLIPALLLITDLPISTLLSYKITRHMTAKVTFL